MLEQQMAQEEPSCNQARPPGTRCCECDFYLACYDDEEEAELEWAESEYGDD